MSSAAPLATVAVANIAELVHQAVGPSAPALLSVSFDGAGNVSLGSWRGFGPFAHPTDPLLCFLAPASWQAIGLIVGGRGRALPGSPKPHVDLIGDEKVVTAVVDRDGTWASVIGEPGQPGRALAETPSGSVADVLHRCLGLATAAPTDSPALWVEQVWLHRVATAVLNRPEGTRTWRDLTDRHPPGRARRPGLTGGTGRPHRRVWRSALGGAPRPPCGRGGGSPPRRAAGRPWGSHRRGPVVRRRLVQPLGHARPAPGRPARRRPGHHPPGAARRPPRRLPHLRRPPPPPSNPPLGLEGG